MAQPIRVSVILPVKDVENELGGILRSIAAQCTGIPTELIIADMGSKDRTVWEGIQLLKELGLPGFVLQNGDAPVSSALNLGIQKACGAYITFVFARRLYRDFIAGYLKTAEETGADFIFGSAGAEPHKTRRAMKAAQELTGTLCAAQLLRGELHIDISAIFLRRDFLIAKRLRFFDLCSHGYAEEFVLRCLLAADTVSESPTVLRRDAVFELRRGKQRSVGGAVFQRVDAMCRVLDTVNARHCADDLPELFRQEKLPQTVMDCVDVLLRENMSYNAIRALLRASGRDRLLETGRHTTRALKHSVRVWKTMPWRYHEGGRK